jgi:ferritin
MSKNSTENTSNILKLAEDELDKETATHAKNLLKEQADKIRNAELIVTKLTKQMEALKARISIGDF